MQHLIKQIEDKEGKSTSRELHTASGLRAHGKVISEIIQYFFIFRSDFGQRSNKTCHTFPIPLEW